MAERIVGISTGVIKEYKPASSLGGSDNFPVAIIETEDPEGNPTEAWIPDNQDLAPQTPVILTRIETEVGNGSHITTQIVPLGRD